MKGLRRSLLLNNRPQDLAIKFLKQFLKVKMYKNVKYSKLQAQTFVEYTLLFGVIVAIFIALTPLIRRSSQAMIKLVADQVSLQENAEQMGGDTGKLVNSEILTSQRREKNTKEFAGIMNYTFVQDDLEVHSDSVSNLGFTQKRP